MNASSRHDQCQSIDGTDGWQIPSLKNVKFYGNIRISRGKIRKATVKCGECTIIIKRTAGQGRIVRQTK